MHRFDTPSFIRVIYRRQKSNEIVQKNIKDFEHPTYWGFCFNEVVLLRANKRDHFLRAIVQWRC